MGVYLCNNFISLFKIWMRFISISGLIMFFNSKKKKAAELSDAILNTFKTGLFNTKYHPSIGQFTLPPNLYKDVYISGFVAHFIDLNLEFNYKDIKKGKNHKALGDFIFSVWENIGLNEEEKEIYVQLMINKEALEKWKADGRYMKGKEHARLCFCCMFQIFADDESSDLMTKAEHMAKNTPDILGNEPYEVKLISAMCELTIYDYLRKNFGGVLISKHDM